MAETQEREVIARTHARLADIAGVAPVGWHTRSAPSVDTRRLLAEHGGRLERRLRSPDRLTEVHLLAFSSAESFAAYRDDPRRAEHAHLLERSGASVEVLEVEDVPA